MTSPYPDLEQLEATYEDVSRSPRSPGDPTFAARDRVIAFFRERLQV